MSRSYWKHVNDVIHESQIIIEVVDARLIQETRNSEIENKVRRSGKQLLYVINKCDLISQQEAEEAKKLLFPSIFISSTERLGTTILKKKLLEMSQGQPVTVGIVGYPNVGKSSVINALAGRASARTSARSGFTQGLQKVRVSPKILLIDTPGVFPYQERDEVKHGLIGAKDASQIRDPERVALILISREAPKIRKWYGVESKDEEELLEEIGKKLGCFLKGGKIDTQSAARRVLQDWQRGKKETFK